MTSGSKPVVVCAEAVAQAERLGFKGDIATELREMLRKSTPFSHENGNRRFDSFMLLVTDAGIEGIDLIDFDPVKQAWKKRKRDRQR